MRFLIGCLVAGLTLVLAASIAAQDFSPELTTALERAGDNANELRAAMEKLPEDQQPGIRFLIENMPERDLRSLKTDYLVENVEYSYRAWKESPWHDQVDEATFLNYILPYASVNERRDDWRRDFYERFHELVKDAKTSGEAAAILNNSVFKELNVRYSTKRARADQGPLQSIESGLASCTGLSIVLIDACRAVGVPARFVGTPLWSDGSGNHSWVEVWDEGWHFTGAAEPSGMNLDAAWFTGRASSAKRDSPRNAIYATSFKPTPIKFPCVWDRRVDYVYAVNVTDRYTSKQEALAVGQGYARFRVLNADGDRVECDVQVTSESDGVVFEGQTRDERFDTNDHLFTTLPLNKPFIVTAKHDGQQASKQIELTSREQLFTLVLKADDTPDKAQNSDTKQSKTDPIADLKRYLSTPRGDREAIENLPFASETLDKEQAEAAQELLWKDHTEFIRQSRKEEMVAKVLTDGELKMPFYYKIFGDKPEGGRSLYISMHGGGGAPKRVNDQQWQNQKRLYEPAEGVYLAPRAPTDTWNLWHEGHIDRIFARLIENLIVTEDVNPDRVYLMGYSAGGDGVYQLAPRMADRWAAAAMMAGHPNDASPLGLRNIGFAIYMGGKDGAFSRNRVAGEWKEKLDKLAADDSGGYNHLVTIYEDKGHWMDREDASSLEWMSKQTRNPLPEKIVWKQDDVTHPRFYWLATADAPQGGALVEATREGQTVDVSADRAMPIVVRLNDQMLDLDEPIKITSGDKVLHDGLVYRTIETIAKTIAERGDPKSVFSGEVRVEVGG